MRASLVNALCVAFLLGLLFHLAPKRVFAQSGQLYITMHTAPIDDYCAPCIQSEKLLKEAGLEFRKIMEPQGPWPWFVLTDAQGNQRTVKGVLKPEDIEAIKKGQWPASR